MTTGTLVQAERQSSFRWVVWVLLVFGTAINFGDRAVFGAVAPLLIKALHLSVAEYGLAATAFSWGYTPIQLIAGIFVARWGARRTWMTAMLVWSICVALTPLAPTFGLLLLVRFIFGATEGSNFPSAGTIVGSWFPASDRGFGLSPNGLGESLGLIIFTPLAVSLAVSLSWQASFFILGGLSLIWLIFASVYLTNKPRESRHVAPAELHYIESGLTVREGKPVVTWRRILTNRTAWGGAISLFTTSYLIYVALSFVPLYLNKTFNVPEAELAGLSIWPWVAAAVGTLIGSRLSDSIYRRTGRFRAARGYLGGAVSLLLAIMLFIFNLLGPNPGVAVAVISFTMFLNGFANIIYFVVPIDVSPQEPARTSGFVVGFASGAGLVAPLLTGLLVSATGNFHSAFYVASAVALVGAIVAPLMIHDQDVIEPERFEVA